MRKILAVAVTLSACATFQTPLGSRSPRLLPRESVYESGFTMLYVSVRINDGNWRGWCDLPDASNTINCSFTYGGIETSPFSVSFEDYRHLSARGARLICDEALWSMGPLHTQGVTNACARRLLEYRWMEDLEHFEDPEAAYREP